MGLEKIDRGSGTPIVPSLTLVNVTLQFFFDGTGNNMYNTQCANC